MENDQPFLKQPRLCFVWLGTVEYVLDNFAAKQSNYSKLLPQKMYALFAQLLWRSCDINCFVFYIEA